MFSQSEPTAPQAAGDRVFVHSDNPDRAYPLLAGTVTRVSLDQVGSVSYGVTLESGDELFPNPVTLHRSQDRKQGCPPCNYVAQALDSLTVRRQAK